ncbi:LCP family protein [Streptomyces sp. TLI_171]|uniref:LCP family glycopolymer transferase n=1 Tax=Streptomyces sp. TLI_171 TaxID=1938859 RepID=UPI000C192953|nr:LCP family protein [Streptomyces sp. TLI_171]RKE20413.1 LytR family transcriptional attenuator [Streptomyces sp. TLI_171]
MTGQRAGASDSDAGWWENVPPQGDTYRQDAPHRDDAPVPGIPRRRSGAHDATTPPRPPGGRADARRAAQQGRGTGRRPEAEPAGPPTGGRAEARRAAQGRRKPRKTKKIIIWSLVGATVAVVGTGGYMYWRLNANIDSFDGDGVSESRPPASAADANGHRPMNILLIGSDSREGANKDLGGGEEGGARSDTTILLHVYADHKHAVGVSFPRDALVNIPKCMLPNKTWTKPQTNVMFNSAFSVGNSEKGNPACTQNTVEAMTDLRVDHTIVVNFEGLASMTEAVGGVEVCLPNAIYEKDLNPNLPRKGKEIYPKGLQTVKGQAALDYVRLRHGIGDGSDVGRMQRQQAFLSSLIKSVKSKGMSPTTLYPLADAATKSLTVDPDLAGVDKLLDLAMSLKDIDLHNIKFLTTPWHYQGDRIGLNHPEVEQLWAALKADRTLDGQDASGGAASPAASAPAAPTTSAPAAPPANGAGIKVGVYNGTTTGGLGLKAAATLKAANFTVTTTGNAPSQNHATTVVQYGSGQKANAQAVAALFPGATVEAGSTAGISLILGKDYAATAGTGATGAPDPGPVPSQVSQDARSADDDPCSKLSYGTG